MTRIITILAQSSEILVLHVLESRECRSARSERNLRTRWLPTDSRLFVAVHEHLSIVDFEGGLRGQRARSQVY